MKLDEFTTAYIEAAFWSTSDDSPREGGEPLDKHYTPSDLEPATLERMIADCKAFQESNRADIYDEDNFLRCCNWSSESQAGHDFWLTRNGHGAGFWDGDWEEKVGERLTAASKAFGEYSLLVGTNGTVYGA